MTKFQIRPFFYYCWTFPERLAMHLEDVLAKNRSLKNLHAEKRCFIIGNGPSIKEQDLKLLKDDMTIVVNSFFCHPDAEIVNPDYWVMASPFAWEQPGMLQPGLDKAVHTKLFVTLPGFEFFSGGRMGPGIDLHYIHFDPLKTIEEPIDFSEGVLHFGHNVVVVSLMLAFFLGCDPIYLIGCDYDFLEIAADDYADKEVYHFYQDSHHTKNSDFLTWEQWLLEMKIVPLEHKLLNFYALLWGHHVFNATEGGYLKTYPRICYESLFPNSNNDLINSKDQQRDIDISKETIEAEYRQLRSLIAEFDLQSSLPAGSFLIESVDAEGECEIEFVCRKCGFLSKVIVAFWFGGRTRCPSCGMDNFIDPFQNASHREDVFFASLHNDPVIALWGAGGIYNKIIKKYPLFVSQRFLLVDGNPSLRGLTLCGKEIHPPDAILKNNIKTVIITAMSRKDEINATLQNDFPLVEHVLIPAIDIAGNGIVPVLRKM